VNRLFVEIYLDEDVNVVVRELLRAQGFNVLTAVEAGQSGRTDAEQLAFAVSQRRVLVTHNRIHFEALALEYFAAERKHCGMIIAVQRPPEQIATRMLAILNQVTADEMENQLRYICWPRESRRRGRLAG
jgi:predicted nuclease of predicted toxin-antitoxin system